MAAQKKGITITVIILVVALLLIIAVWKVYEKKMERMEKATQTKTAFNKQALLQQPQK